MAKVVTLEQVENQTRRVAAFLDKRLEVIGVSSTGLTFSYKGREYTLTAPISQGKSEQNLSVSPTTLTDAGTITVTRLGSGAITATVQNASPNFDIFFHAPSVEGNIVTIRATGEIRGPYYTYSAEIVISVEETAEYEAARVTVPFLCKVEPDKTPYDLAFVEDNPDALIEAGENEYSYDVMCTDFNNAEVGIYRYSIGELNPEDIVFKMEYVHEELLEQLSEIGVDEETLEQLEDTGEFPDFVWIDSDSSEEVLYVRFNYTEAFDGVGILSFSITMTLPESSDGFLVHSETTYTFNFTNEGA